jgi:putative hemolysin
MPKAFEACVKNGGRIRTKKLSDGKYIHICFLNGKSYAGEVRKKETEKKWR